METNLFTLRTVPSGLTVLCSARTKRSFLLAQTHVIDTDAGRVRYTLRETPAPIPKTTDRSAALPPSR